MNKRILAYLDNTLNEIVIAFTYQKILDLTGVSDILEEMYIETKELNSKYISIFYKAIKEFKNLPLYKELSLDNEKDLKVLRVDDQFKSKIRATIFEIKKDLNNKSVSVLESIKKNISNKKMSLDDLIKIVELDKATLLFILDDLKDEGLIYDYNGREVLLK